MKHLNFVKKFSEYRINARLVGDKFELIVSPEMAESILESLHIYELIETGLKEFGKKIKTW